MNDNMKMCYGPVNEASNTIEKYWSGVNQYYIEMKKKHNLIKMYEYYWFVYGTQGYIYFFTHPDTNYGVKCYLLKNMKYMTVNQLKIILWNDHKRFSIKFINKADKDFFDKYYLKSINGDTNFNILKQFD